MGVGWTWWFFLPDHLCRVSLEGSLSTLPPYPSLWLHTISQCYRWRYKSALPERSDQCPVQVSHWLFIFPRILWFLLSKPICSPDTTVFFLFFFENLLGCFEGWGSPCKEPPLLLSGLLITNRESLVCEVRRSQLPGLVEGARSWGDLKCNFLYLFHFLLGVVQSNKQGGWQGQQPGQVGDGRGKHLPTLFCHLPHFRFQGEFPGAGALDKSVPGTPSDPALTFLR